MNEKLLQQIETKFKFKISDEILELLKKTKKIEKERIKTNVKQYISQDEFFQLYLYFSPLGGKKYRILPHEISNPSKESLLKNMKQFSELVRIPERTIYARFLQAKFKKLETLPTMEQKSNSSFEKKRISFSEMDELLRKVNENSEKIIFLLNNLTTKSGLKNNFLDEDKQIHKIIKQSNIELYKQKRSFDNNLLVTEFFSSYCKNNDHKLRIALTEAMLLFLKKYDPHILNTLIIKLEKEEK